MRQIESIGIQSLIELSRLSRDKLNVLLGKSRYYSVFFGGITSASILVLFQGFLSPSLSMSGLNLLYVTYASLYLGLSVLHLIEEKFMVKGVFLSQSEISKWSSGSDFFKPNNLFKIYFFLRQNKSNTSDVYLRTLQTYTKLHTHVDSIGYSICGIAFLVMNFVLCGIDQSRAGVSFAVFFGFILPAIAVQAIILLVHMIAIKRVERALHEIDFSVENESP